MRDQIGKWIPPGIGEGIKNAMPNLHLQMDEEMLSLTNTMKATVDLETKKTFLSAGSSIRLNTPSINSIDDEKENIFIVKNYMDSEEISEYTYKNVNGEFTMASKRMR